jgi:hypothetical protein
VSARFIVSRKCETKERLTLTGLIDLQRQLGLLASLEELVASGELEAADEDEPYELVFPAAGETTEVSLGRLKEQTACLTGFRRVCRLCPANGTGQVGGCVTYLPYPVSEGLEFLFWLAGRLALSGRLSPATAPAVLAFLERAAALQKTPWADGMRQAGYLMASRPWPLSWGPLWARRRLSSSHLLERFFRTPVLTGEDLTAHTGFLAAVVGAGRSLARALERDEERLSALREDLAAYERLYRYMQRAAALEEGVQVWP